jgi:hypothetical protein
MAPYSAQITRIHLQFLQSTLFENVVVSTSYDVSEYSALRLFGLSENASNLSLSVLLNSFQVTFVSKTLRVKFEDIFRPGWSHREPSTLGDYLDSTDRLPIARRVRQFLHSFFSSEHLHGKLTGLQLGQAPLVLRRGWGIYPLIE